MDRIVLWRSIPYGVVGALLCLSMGCALSGSVVNTGNIETVVTDMRMEHGRSVKVYYGGASRQIPLKDIQTIVVNPAVPVTIDNVLCYSAVITLKDGTLIQSTEKDESIRTEVFVSVQQELVCRRNGERFTTGFEHILRLTVQ